MKTLVNSKQEITELREERDEAVNDYHEQLAKVQNNLDRRRELNAEAKRRIEKWKDDTWRTLVHEPSWPEEKSTSGFLYDNLRDKGRELRIRSALVRAAMCLRREDLDKADEYVSEALPLATTLNYPPLVAKCCFWKFMVRHAEGRREAAARALVVAKACVGRYIESEETEEWLVEYRDTIRQLRLNFDNEFAKEMRKGRKKARALELEELG